MCYRGARKGRCYPQQITTADGSGSEGKIKEKPNAEKERSDSLSPVKREEDCKLDNSTENGEEEKTRSVGEIAGDS